MAAQDGGPNMLAQFMRLLTSTFGLFAINMTYLLLGAWLFLAIEAPREESLKNNLEEEREILVDHIISLGLGPEEYYRGNASAKLALYELQLANFYRKRATFEIGSSNDSLASLKLWSYEGAIIYCYSVITTIGWGNIVPNTVNGKLGTVIYGLNGMPLFFSLSSEVSTVCSKAIFAVWNSFRRTVLPLIKNKPPAQGNRSASKSMSRSSSDRRGRREESGSQNRASDKRGRREESGSQNRASDKRGRREGSGSQNTSSDKRGRREESESQNTARSHHVVTSYCRKAPADGAPGAPGALTNATSAAMLPDWTGLCRKRGQYTPSHSHADGWRRQPRSTDSVYLKNARSCVDFMLYSHSELRSGREPEDVPHFRVTSQQDAMLLCAQFSRMSTDQLIACMDYAGFDYAKEVLGRANKPTIIPADVAGARTRTPHARMDSVGSTAIFPCEGTSTGVLNAHVWLGQGTASSGTTCVVTTKTSGPNCCSVVEPRGDTAVSSDPTHTRPVNLLDPHQHLGPGTVSRYQPLVGNSNQDTPQQHTCPTCSAQQHTCPTLSAQQHMCPTRSAHNCSSSRPATGTSQHGFSARLVQAGAGADSAARVGHVCERVEARDRNTSWPRTARGVQPSRVQPLDSRAEVMHVSQSPKTQFHKLGQTKVTKYQKPTRPPSQDRPENTTSTINDTASKSAPAGIIDVGNCAHRANKSTQAGRVKEDAGLWPAGHGDHSAADQIYNLTENGPRLSRELTTTDNRTYQQPHQLTATDNTGQDYRFAQHDSASMPDTDHAAHDQTDNVAASDQPTLTASADASASKQWGIFHHDTWVKTQLQASGRTHSEVSLGHHTIGQAAPFSDPQTPDRDSFGMAESGSNCMGHAQESGSNCVGHAQESGSNCMGHAQESGSNCMGQAQERGSNCMGHAQERGSNCMGQAQERGSNCMGHAQERGSNCMGHAQERGSNCMGHAQERGSNCMGHAQERGSNCMGRAQESESHTQPAPEMEREGSPRASNRTDGTSRVMAADNGSVSVLTEPQPRSLHGDVSSREPLETRHSRYGIIDRFVSVMEAARDKTGQFSMLSKPGQQTSLSSSSNRRAAQRPLIQESKGSVSRDSADVRPNTPSGLSYNGTHQTGQATQPNTASQPNTATQPNTACQPHPRPHTGTACGQLVGQVTRGNQTAQCPVQSPKPGNINENHDVESDVYDEEDDDICTVYSYGRMKARDDDDDDDEEEFISGRGFGFVWKDIPDVADDDDEEDEVEDEEEERKRLETAELREKLAALELTDDAAKAKAAAERQGQVEERFHVPLFVMYILVILYVLMGTVVFYIWDEALEFWDSLYFIYVMLSTTGFGDLLPKPYMYFFIVVYGLVGMALYNILINATLELFMEVLEYLASLGDGSKSK